MRTILPTLLTYGLSCPQYLCNVFPNYRSVLSTSCGLWGDHRNLWAPVAYDDVSTLLKMHSSGLDKRHRHKQKWQLEVYRDITLPQHVLNTATAIALPVLPKWIQNVRTQLNQTNCGKLISPNPLLWANGVESPLKTRLWKVCFGKLCEKLALQI